MEQLGESDLWNGLFSSLVSAVVAAVVAVAAVYLSTKSTHRSWYEKQRIEAFASVLDGFNQCWEFSGREFNFPSHHFIPESSDDEAPLLDETKYQQEINEIRNKQVDELRLLVGATLRKINIWTMYLKDGEGKEVEETVKRAIEVLFDEWHYSSFMPRGTFALEIPQARFQEWEQMMKLARIWHQSESVRKRRKTEKEISELFRKSGPSFEEIMKLDSSLTEGRFTLD
ncbi:hypothetical protein [Micrococcoides hystricis]|uniref:DUF4760 domain-containing protein n=1 Tax=Micrococcoides hystricis TaxID=1572761 RepID=A0ABV6P9S8_9MICC